MPSFAGPWFSLLLVEAGPGRPGDGAYWGAATDEKRVYAHIAVSLSPNFTLKPSKKKTTSGGWVALDVQSGGILWSICDPSNVTTSGPVIISNGVLFAGSTYKTGPIYAMNAKNGEILWSYKIGATIYGGMLGSDGCVYVGNGYKESFEFVNPNYTAGTHLFAFCISLDGFHS
ncbi:hypothetical protein K2173_020206 [Erythroxylum novogranatense]|uniref:Pyrrolo-quinoline quinone repeat domain-containing protein n=1 Tax=Erythroxylum novogranatense TaxID=1862640 RepID=A0AAV8U772_9ROSI|nr:hypothetical protein K2173_020206 [Erythroxylum novogranatense]